MENSIPTEPASKETPVEELGDKYASLSLGKEAICELEIQESLENGGQGEHIDLRWAAVGRFLSEKAIKFDVMRQVLASVWRPVFGIHVKELSGNLYLFQFFHEKDICRILNEGPWSFENSTLILKRLMDGDQPTKVTLDHCEF